MSKRAPKFGNIQPWPNPKPIEVMRVEVNLIDRETSARMGMDIYRPAGVGYIRKRPLM